MSLAQPQALPPHNANRSLERISTDYLDAEESTRQTLLNITPENDSEKLPHLPLTHWHSALNWKSTLKIALVLILATSYLTFCVIAYYRAIPIGGKGVVSVFFFNCERYLCYAAIISPI